jgi:hypothetical protein
MNETTLSGFEAFREVISRELLEHPVIRANSYTTWFKGGEASHDQVVDLITQFSVFSNHFLVAQVKRMVFADTEEGERCARNILMSECGVGLDPRSGECEGRSFVTSNAHINWLRECGAALDIPAMDHGRWHLANPSTKAFLRALEATYGSPDSDVGLGASFAIECWAAFGIGHAPELEAKNFWAELIAGLEIHNSRRAAAGNKPLPLGFFKYHFALESGHGANVWTELEASFKRPGFSQAKFLRGGKKALKAIHTFWLGLDESRRRLERERPRIEVDRSWPRPTLLQ